MCPHDEQGCLVEPGGDLGIGTARFLEPRPARAGPPPTGTATIAAAALTVTGLTRHVTESDLRAARRRRPPVSGHWVAAVRSVPRGVFPQLRFPAGEVAGWHLLRSLLHSPKNR
ncbi:hypothetical protein ACFQ51_09665 [Streptomyces kaempferi]